MPEEPEVIDQFAYKYAFLSNSFNCPVTYNHTTYRNAEAAYQAQKCPKRSGEFTNLTAVKAIQLGKKVKLDPLWEERKLVIMKNVVGFKFGQNPALRKKLLETGNVILIDGTGDTFWGSSAGKGENHLGLILMDIRNLFNER